MKSGDKVKVVLTDNSFYHKCQWWPHGEIVTAEVLTVYKNGVIKVAFDFLSGNGSTQGRKGINVNPKNATFTIL